MEIFSLPIVGTWKIEFKKFSDNRGYFYESFNADNFEKKIGRKLNIKQTNTSSSRKGVLRGIHFAVLPPSQAKLVQCLKGSIIDFIIDIRIGSPTFGQFIEINLNENLCEAIFIEEGLAHAFVSLEDDTVVSYYVSEKYNPDKEISINPFDKTLNVKWPALNLILSDKDKTAISLLTAKEMGLLPIYEQCQQFVYK